MGKCPPTPAGETSIFSPSTQLLMRRRLSWFALDFSVPAWCAGTWWVLRREESYDLEITGADGSPTQLQREVMEPREVVAGPPLGSRHGLT